MLGHVYEYRMPLLIRAIGGRWCDGRRSWRMSWGELNIKPSCALSLCMFSEHFSLHVGLIFIDAYIRLGFLQRWHREPHEGMESWGFSIDDRSIYLRWGRRYKFIYWPWDRWVQTSHEVLTVYRDWNPYVGSWETGKKPDLRATETHLYRYMLASGEVQIVDATIYVERSTRKLRWLRWLPYGRTTYAIQVEFSDEVGEQRGSWKGGCVGCGYELRPGETPRACLYRMQEERRFR